jgi:TonB family protein
MITRKTFASLLCILAFFTSTAKTTISQQNQVAQPTPQKSIEVRAVTEVVEHYRIDTQIVVPDTGKPLTSDGKWAVSKNVPDSCPKTAYPCVRVLYNVPDAGVACEWTVLLMGGADQNVILGLNEDAAKYLTMRGSGHLSPLHAISQAAPYYPATARVGRIQGTVKMLVQIAATGRVDEAKAVSGPPELRSAAVDAVKQWIYKPLIIDANPVPQRAIVVINFHLGSNVQTFP